MTDTAVPGPLVNSAIQKPAVFWLWVVCRNSLFQLEKFNNYTVFLKYFINFSSVQSLSCVNSATPWTAARQASLSITISWSSLKLMSIESVMPSNHLILCCPLLLLPSVLPSIEESALHMRWPKYWSFSFNISPSNEY